jgi:hypothetical protein
VAQVVLSVFEQLARVAHGLRDSLLRRLTLFPDDGVWRPLADRYAACTGNAEPTRFADAYAQAVVCTAFFDRVCSDVLANPRVVRWLVGQADPLVARCLSDGLSLAGEDPVALQSLERLAQADRSADNPVYFYERFLRGYDARRRRRRGVYYTPVELVDFIVGRADAILRREFQLADGLADTSTWSQVLSRQTGRNPGADDAAFVRVLDPAMGTGAFLLGVTRRCYERFCQTHTGSSRDDCQARWQTFVTDHLLPRLVGFELMLPALVLAQLQLATELANTGFQFRRAGKLHCYLANTLDQPLLIEQCLDGQDPRVTVVLGNPPFSGVSHNRQVWLRDLMRGRSPDRIQDAANYFSVDGVPLGERKHWLADDYVKFLRYGHWQLERSRAGVMGLVTNHGFLDNPTFRGMRQQLLKTFPRMTIVDLHGNAKNRERTPDGEIDQNVFDIEQGVAVSLMRCGGEGDGGERIEHVDLWGRRAGKLQTLREDRSRPLAVCQLKPRAPYYFLAPRQFSGSERYQRGFRLSDIMPLNSTAAVTARDHFLIAFDEQQLVGRLREFCDPAVSDDQLRRCYFSRTRSTRYPPGDTRGWKLRQARETARHAGDLRQLVRDFQYRPFDYRRIFWADWIVDWPRPAVTRHLLQPGNLALIARRQAPASAAASYFWVTDSIVLDGLIRSDNRGSESMFPLWIIGEEPTANFAAEFIDVCGRQLGLKWKEHGPTDPQAEFGPQDLLHYIYALFFCPSYRQQFASWLRVDFPRVLLPNRAGLFRTMAALGCKLVQRHLLKQAGPVTVSFTGAGGSSMVDSGYPRFADDRVWVNARDCFAPVASATWSFQVGTYQVCRKWLKDRAGRVLSAGEVTHYCHILSALARTRDLMREIDAAIVDAGGWDQAF